MINKTEEENREDPQNKREQYKQIKLEESRQVYNCECGKNYLTFAALYLHARNKHNIKLTTKRNNQNSKVQEIGDKTHITYFIFQPSNSQSPIISSQKNINFSNQNSAEKSSLPQSHQTIIQKYLSQHQYQLSQSQVTIFHHFLSYFESVSKQQFSDLYDKNSDITLYFNEFTVFFYPRTVMRSAIKQKSKRNEVESALMDFYSWLKGKKMTKYEIVYTPSRHISDFL